ncbi:MAG: DUF4274 domain-containing protein [Myxococcales bacterium]|nr:DUF4274 domain-containing protein [Myxococcales bacterium]
MADLAQLSSTDRGFLTWVAGMAREPLDEVWDRLLSASSSGSEVGTSVVDGHLVSLDLSPLNLALRWAVGEERRISPPLGGLDRLRALDVSGLGLNALDMASLPALEELRCADNRLQELDLTANRVLRRLDCSGNELMVLDLRDNVALEEVVCAGNGLGVLVLPPESGPMRQLDCSRNQLMVLELGDRPSIEVVRAFRNALVRFQAGAVDALRELDLGRNDLSELACGAMPAVAELSLGRNQLSELDLAPFPALRVLRCHKNWLAQLDLRPCPDLRFLDAHGNQLESVVLEGCGALEELQISENRLRELPLDGLSHLLILNASHNDLTSLALDGAPDLAQLDVSQAALRSLDPSSAPRLVDLRCDRNPLEQLDITGNPDLVRLRTRDGDTGPVVEATPVQRRLLGELRAVHALGSSATEIEQMDVFELHELAVTMEGRDAEERLLRIVRAPDCDLGTALMIYWTSSPHYYLRYADREEVTDYERLGWDLLATVEQRVADGSYTHRQIRFDPRDDRQTRSVRGVDWTVDDRIVRVPAQRSIPEVMFRPSWAL